MMAKLERSPQQARMEAVSRDALVQAALQAVSYTHLHPEGHRARPSLLPERCSPVLHPGADQERGRKRVRPDL